MNSCRFALPLLLLVAGPTAAQETRIDAPIGPRGSTGTLYLFLFDPAQVSLKVLPATGKSGKPSQNLGEVMTGHQCLAGCTAAAPSPSGAEARPAAVVRLGDHRLRIVRQQQATLQSPPILSAGPFLVEGGKANAKLPAGRTARRTFLLTDGSERWAIGYAPATTLPKLAAALATPKLLGDWQVATAVILDSGSGTGIWMQRRHAPLYLKEIRKVGSFVGLLPR